MLEKNPDRRPLVRDVVRTDFIKGHISKLLSHTLKSGNGGALPQPAPSTHAAPQKNVDIVGGAGSQEDDVDGDIEAVRTRQRAAELAQHEKEAKLRSDKQVFCSVLFCSFLFCSVYS